MGWLADWSSDFSINHISNFIHDPHKELVDYGTKGFQRTIGPIALNQVPYVGPFLSAGARAWLSNESKNPTSHNYKSPDSTPAAQAGQGIATEAVSNPSFLNVLSGSQTPSGSTSKDSLGVWNMLLSLLKT